MKINGNKIPEEVVYAAKKLNNSGFSACPVGGCIRDSILGREPSDWDMTTSAEPEDMLNVFKDDRIIETGIKHGTVTLVRYGKPLEITTYRIDGQYRDMRRPEKVIFTRNIEDDLARRDFTVNAMAFDMENRQLIDPFGGRNDLEKGILRCVGRPYERFNEDGLRILRALRFASVYDFEIEDETGEAIKKCRYNLKKISAERIKREMDLLLCGNAAGKILREYREVFTVFIPELEPMFEFEQHNTHHIYDVWEHTIITLENAPAEPVMRWTALFHDIGKPDTFFTDEEGIGHFYGHAKTGAQISDTIMERLRFDKKTKTIVELLVKDHDRLFGLTEKSIRKRMNEIGEENFRRILDLARADNMGQNPIYRYRQETFDQAEQIANLIIERNECFSLKNLAVDGNDIKALGFKGREIGKILNYLLELVIDGKASNCKKELLDEVENFV